MRKRSARPSRQYAAIPNAAMRDETLSIGARGLLALLMTYSDEWVFKVDHLQRVAKCGRDAMRSMLKELHAAGYVVREAIRREDNKLAGTQWLIVDDPSDPSPCATNGEPAPELVENAASRPPENPSVGENAQQGPKEYDRFIYADSLTNRPPGGPTAGKSTPIRRTKEKEEKEKKPQPPPKDSLDALAESWVKPVKQGKSYAAHGISKTVAQRMIQRDLVAAEDLRKLGVVF